MKLSEFKSHLNKINEINFTLSNGEKVPSHFHVTEVGLVKKHFIDCGGTIRKENTISFQLYTASDYDHRLEAQKLRSIIHLSESQLNLPDAEIEVEYQNSTIGKYGLEFNGQDFILTTKQTDCLAKESCGINDETKSSEEACCTPGGGCC